MRLDTLPGLLRSFHWFSEEYRSFEKEVRAEAKPQECAPRSLGRKRDWPDVYASKLARWQTEFHRRRNLWADMASAGCPGLS
jgi:hypothetical protein